MAGRLEKIEKFLFYFLIFAIPLGTKKVLYRWGGPAAAAGDFSEWQSAVFYFTDGLLLLLFLIWIIRNGSVRPMKNKSLAIFLGLAAFSILAARIPGLGFYQWLRLAEMVLFFIYLRERLFIFDLKRVFGVFIASAVFQSFIAVGQAMMQKSLFGDLGRKLLGESLLGTRMDDVAGFISHGTRILRAYGTLPHPNVLAAFLVTAIFFLLYLYFKRTERRDIFIFVPVYFLLLFALFLTFSRGIILIFIFILVCWALWLVWKEKGLRTKIFYTLLVLIISYSLLSSIFYRQEVASRYQFSRKEEAVSMRIFYDELALIMTVKNPALGVGIGNFVLRIDDYLTPQLKTRYELSQVLKPGFYQPVHNIFLLVGAEMGLGALAVFGWFLFPIFKRGFRLKKEFCAFGFLFSGFLLFGLFDHFFLTLPPAMLIFWLAGGILSSENSFSSPPANK